MCKHFSKTPAIISSTTSTNPMNRIEATIFGIVMFAIASVITKFVFKGSLDFLIALMILFCYIELLKLSPTNTNLSGDNTKIYGKSKI